MTNLFTARWIDACVLVVLAACVTPNTTAASAPSAPAPAPAPGPVEAPAEITAQDDWPGFMGPDRSGTVPDADIATDWPKDGPPVVWKRPLGPGFGGAAIHDNTVYLLDRDALSGDTLKAFDLDTGKPLYEIPYSAPGRASYHGSRSTPSIHNARAFTVGPFGHVTAFDLSKQSVAWQQHMDDYDAPPPKFAWSQSPLILGDLVVVAPMSQDTGLVALRQDTGQVVWRSGFIGHEGYSSPRLVTLAGQTQIVTLTSTLVTAVHPETGDILWSYDNIPVRRGIPTPTPLPGDKLFITAGYDAGSALLQIKQTRDGRFNATELKRINDQGGQIHTPLLVGEHLYVNLNTNENLRRGPTPGLGCFDLQGNLLWTNNNTPDLNRGPVLALGKHLITLGGEDGTLRLIQADPTGYKEIASAKRFNADAKRNMIWGPMAYAKGYLILRSQNQLKCIDLRPKP